MKNVRVLFCAVFVAGLVLLLYVVHFFGASLSNESSDWGAFGNYIGVGLSAISIALIYITYSEQGLSNKIARFEQRFITMTKILEELAEKRQDITEYNYQLFTKHFLLDSGISGYDRDKVAKTLVYYYSALSMDNTSIFRYLSMSIEFIRGITYMSDEEKKGRIIELSCIVPESIRIFYLCWQLSKAGETISKDYKDGLFTLEEDSPKLLYDIISFVCSGKEQTSNAFESNVEYGITLKDYSEELFCDTYSRINK